MWTAHCWRAEHVDRFASTGAADLVESLCQPVPSISTMAGLGLPLERFSRYVDLFHRVNQIDPLHDAPDVQARIHADVGDLLADVAQLVTERYAQPQDDWVSLYLQLDYDGQRLPVDEVVGNVLLTFAGGVDTTAQLTGWTLYYLGKDPELRARLGGGDRSLLRQAFDEFLRFASPVQGIARTISDDTELNDFVLRGDRKIFVALAAANRDPAAFPNPDVLDIDWNAKRHLGFGAGPHRCLGSFIARVWWEEMVAAVLERIPDYVIDDDNVVIYPAGAIQGLAKLPVTFTPENVL